MKIHINLNIFLFIILFYFTKQIDIYSIIMIFALIHEISHLVCGILLGFKPETLNIMPLGFNISFKTVVNDYNKKIGKSNILSLKKIIIATAGPIANLIIAVLGVILNFNINIIYANILICLFNLIPIYPLDGGRILKNLFKIFYGNFKAYTYIQNISNILLIFLTCIASILILIYKNISIFFIIVVLWIMIIEENKKYIIYNKIYKSIDKNINYL